MVELGEFKTKSAYPMIPFEQAWAIVESSLKSLPPRTAVLRDLVGLVLAEDVVALADMPPFPSSSMDGYALIAADGGVNRRLLGEIEAGSSELFKVEAGTATRIMTGAPLPLGADAVIPVEDTSERDGAMIPARAVKKGENIRLAGSDLRQGDPVVGKGATLGPAEIGLLASVGRSKVSAHPRIRVVVLATGDELVPPGETLAPGKIHDSNSYALRAAVELAGGVVVRTEHVIDVESNLKQALLDAVRDADLVLTSGGVSMGTRDFIKPILAELGQIHFGRVAMKPGKPLTFATVDGVPVFGLPGFPVSSLVTFEMVVRPALRLLGGHSRLWRPVVSARLEHALRHGADRAEFQRVVLTPDVDGYRARTTGSQVSSRLRSLVGANGLLRIPQGVGDLSVGALVDVILLDQPEVEGQR